VAHPDANIIFGQVIDDSMGDEVRVTVIAAGFDRWEDQSIDDRAGSSGGIGLAETERELREEEEDLGLVGDEFDVPDFLK
jgi:cell division protein FtsZ